MVQTRGSSHRRHEHHHHHHHHYLLHKERKDSASVIDSVPSISVLDEYADFNIIEAPDFEPSDDESVQSHEKVLDRIRDEKGHIDLGMFRKRKCNDQGFELDIQLGSEMPEQKSNALQVNTNNSKNIVEYEFGDKGSVWRMMKLEKTLEVGRSSNIEEVALERYGDLQLFHDALDEKKELERRLSVKDESKWVYGPEVKRDEISDSATNKVFVPTPEITSADISTARLDMLKSRIRKLPDYKIKEDRYHQLKEQYDEGLHHAPLSSFHKVKLPTEVAVDENDMTIDQLLRQERLTSVRSELEASAKQLASVHSFDDRDLDYQDEIASQFAHLDGGKNRTKSLKLIDNPKLARSIRTCFYCCDNRTSNPLMVKSSDSFYITLMPQPEITHHGCMIVPHEHLRNSLQLDTEQFQELRDIMQELSLFYYNEYHESVIFYENSVLETSHFTIGVMPLPLTYTPSVLKTYFVDGIMQQYDENTSSHQPLIMTSRERPYDSLIAKEAPYYHVWFTLDGGLGHIVENKGWPKGDLFTRQVVGGLLDVDQFKIRAKTRIVDDPGLIKTFKEKLGD
ncbi:hypothetical protein FOA43_001392 [Brettanomyces nanus]|uniref:Uncharacterized protein n=1 Tax=Eeniella nana TaxID=13502 RepID=A0A875RXA5_EENNA|nr:uncharacterized protein FOA43_001392 [Brettanomyces nanus]QPG74071.1 hypothetical protein FOA43_001392 [Brettanomyces nanus]